MKPIMQVGVLLTLVLITSCGGVKKAPQSTLATPPERSLAQMDPNVAQVVSGGLWQEGGKSGHYRLITACGGWEEVSCVFFLQWLEEPGDSGEDPKVVASIEVPELDHMQFYKAKLSITDRLTSSCVITVIGANPYEERQYAVAVKPGSLRKYVVERLPD